MRTLLLLQSLFLLPASGQSVFSFLHNTTSKQIGPFETEFINETMITSVRDGSNTFAACIINNSPFIYLPSIFCPLGTTGKIIEGGFNYYSGGGLDRYFSIASIQPAFELAPFRADLVQLVDAPEGAIEFGTPSDESVLWEYNVLTPPTSSLPVSRYRFATKTYLASDGEEQATLRRTEFPYGRYRFQLPLLNGEGRTFIRDFDFLETGSAYRRTSDNSERFRISNSPTQWVNGFLELDPRIDKVIQWAGISGENISSRISITNPENSQVATFYNPQNGNFENSQNLFGYYERYFRFKINDLSEDNRIARGNLHIFKQSGNTSGSHTIEWDIRFVDRYAGFQKEEFNANAGILQNAPHEDHDKDGVSNFEEFATNTDPNNSDDFPLLLYKRPTGLGLCTAEWNKRPYIAGTTNYIVQYYNGVNAWQTIQPDSQLFNLTETEDQIAVVNTAALQGESCQLRLVISDTPLDRDSDGLPDSWEMSVGLSALDDGSEAVENGPLGDPDADGLSNALELKYGTDPRLSDTDGDQQSDGVELSQGTSPIDQVGEIPLNPEDILVSLDGRVEITFDAVLGKRYRLLVHTNDGWLIVDEGLAISHRFTLKDDPLSRLGVQPSGQLYRVTAR